MSQTNLSDTTGWLPLDGLAPGFDANKAEPSGDLADRTITVRDRGGTMITHRFETDTMSWTYSPADDTPPSEGVDPYEAVRVDDGLYFVQFQHTDLRHEAVSLVLDLTHGRALSVIAVIGEAAPGRTAVQQNFVPSQIIDINGRPAEVAGVDPAPSTALVGRRVLWVYSAEHAYEHVYLSPHWYTWQCLAGPERGLADTDENSVWKIRRGIYVFTWREKVIPCGSVTIADHRDAHSVRSHGVLFGLDGTGNTPVHFTFGAYGRLISTTVHPVQFDPAHTA